MNILIIDENNSGQQLLSIILKKVFFQAHCDSVFNTLDGIRKFQSEVYDFVFLNLSLPQAQDFDFISKIHLLYPNTQIIAISEAEYEHELKKTINIGAGHYLIKPLSIQQIKSLSLKPKSSLKKESHTKKVLIADDDKTSINLLKKILEKENYDISEASNGWEAFLKAENEVFDVILMDLRMPFMDGFEATLRIKRVRPNIPIVAITAEEIASIKEQGLFAGISHFLSKPIRKKAVKDTLKKYTQSIQDSTPTSPSSTKQWLLISNEETLNNTVKFIAQQKNAKLEIKSKFQLEEIKNYYQLLILNQIPPNFGKLSSIPIIIVGTSFKSSEKFSTIDQPFDYIQQNASSDEWTFRIDRMLSNTTKLHSLKEYHNNYRDILFEFHKLLPRNFLNRNDFMSLNRGISEIKDCSVLFMDIRNFTQLSNNISPEDCFRFLNSYFEVVEPIINNFKGFVYQFLGDGIISIFPKNEDLNNGNQAVHAAISVHDILKIYNKGRIRAGFSEIRIGCGIASGDVAFGITGSKNRIEPGAFGKTVNLASRCESFCSEVGAGIIISEKTFMSMSNPLKFPLRYLGEHLLKGIDEPINLFEIFIQETPKVRQLKGKTSSILNQFYQPNLKDRSLDHHSIDDLYHNHPEDLVLQKLLKKLKSYSMTSEV